MSAATDEMMRFGEIEFVPDDSLPPGMIGYRAADGMRLCVACGCREDAHCEHGHECLTRVGQDEECLCAKFTPAVATCIDCGWQFAELWHLQNHRLPTPTCLSSAWAAGGRYAERTKFDPPLRPKRVR